MSVSQPNVPDTAGVPPVARADGVTTATEPKATEDAVPITVTALQEWGIYNSSDELALEADSVTSVGYDSEFRIADFPIEQGGFESFDKVSLPFQARVVLTKGGTIEDRRTFLAALNEIRSDTKLYSVVTPERAYLDVNITRVSIDRSREQGAGLISVEIVLQEIRQTVDTTYTSSTAEPSGADVRNDGTVQPQAADEATKQIVETKSAAVTAPRKTPFFSSKLGQTLVTVATAAGFPAQTLVTQLGGKSIGVTLAQKATGLFADISMNGLPVVAGALCRDAVPLVNAAHLGFPGDLALFDMKGNSDPDFTGLGSRFKLLWASAT